MLVLLLGLQSCTNLSPPSSPPLEQSWTERTQKIEKLNNWDLRGALAAHTPTDGGSLSFTWAQTGSHYAISLFGPLGANAIQINGQPGLVKLTAADGKQFSAQDPEQLLRDQLGWNFPISSLHYWIRGLPAPGTQADNVFDAHHRLSKLRQGPWQIEYKQYAVFNGLELPTRIFLVHPQLNIKIVISSWGQV